MKTFKHITAAHLTLAMLSVSAGCQNVPDDDHLLTGYIGAVEGDTRKNLVLPIYNADDQEIGSITRHGYIAFAGGCILYSKGLENPPSPEAIEYWLYDIETKENYMLGVADSGYNMSCEATEVDGHLYLGLASGGYMDRENSKVTVYDIDLSEHSMKPLLEVEGGIQFDSYTIANGKLIFAELLYNGHTDLIEYDLTEKRDSPVVHAYDESDEFVSDSIRSIYADDKNIYMVRLHKDESENYFLYLDTYDFDYDLISTVDIREFCKDTRVAVSDPTREKEIRTNDWQMFIDHFFIHGDLVYYENSNNTTDIGMLKDGGIDRLFETPVYFTYVDSASEGDKYDLFHQSWGGVSVNTKNIFYRVDPETGKTETAEFYADNRLYGIFSAKRDSNKILIKMGYTDPDTGEDLPERLYYIDMNDLDFKPME